LLVFSFFLFHADRPIILSIDFPMQALVGPRRHPIHTAAAALLPGLPLPLLYCVCWPAAAALPCCRCGTAVLCMHCHPRRKQRANRLFSQPP